MPKWLRRLPAALVAFVKGLAPGWAIPFWSSVILILITLIGVLTFDHPTPEQVAQLAQKQEINRQSTLAHQEAEERKAPTVALQSQRYKNLCHTAAVCTKYATTRQECATAGSFRTCIDVKMGDDAAIIGACTNEGGLLSQPVDMLAPMKCFLIEKLGID
jgi:hypothetical protein